MVTRCAFDHFLVEKAAAAGARVYDACRVTRLEVQAQSLHVRTEKASWYSRYLAFADGAKGTLRRQLGFTEVATHDIGLDMEIDVSPPCPWTPDTLYIDWARTRKPMRGPFRRPSTGLSVSKARCIVALHWCSTCGSLCSAGIFSLALANSVTWHICSPRGILVCHWCVAKLWC